MVAEGTVGGEPLQLDAGFYRVKVSGHHLKALKKIEIIGEKERFLSINVSMNFKLLVIARNE